jgi:hypothetical protein
MSAAEVGHRCAQALRARAESAGWLRAKPPPPALPRDAPRWLARPREQPHADALLERADRIAAGRFDVLHLDDVALGMPPRWNRDPETGIEAPFAFGKRIDYRDTRVVGNIKTPWEPARHLELATLAQAWAASGDDKYLRACRTLLHSWLEQCPYPLGVHWASSLELAIRLVNWSAAWSLLGGFGSPLFDGSEGRALRDEWLASVYRHCHFIEHHRSLHSSANNHLLGEWLGLFVSASTWPCWPAATRWRAIARSGFEAEALKQNAPDGVNREQATGYHREVAEMMLIARAVARAAGGGFSPEYRQRLEAMLDFVLALIDAGGRVPMIGDADDALMLRLHHEPDWDPFRSLLASGAALFHRADFKAAAGGFDTRSRWLLGDAGAQAFAALPAAPAAARKRLFEHGGYAVLGSGFGTAGELKIVADAGPLGYLAIAAHGHADALAFTLSAHGRELLVDPGTYAYHTERRWRDHFRGTAAHNTVRIDGVDSSRIGGAFLWLHKANATLHECSFGPERDVWEASHDGYRRLADPVVHRRRIEVEHASATIVVTDTLSCVGEHAAEFCWQFAEDVDVEVVDDVVVARAGALTLRMAMPETTRAPRLLKGSVDPIAGWVSRRFGVKQPAPAVRWPVTVRGTGQWRTEIRLHAATRQRAHERREETAS